MFLSLSTGLMQRLLLPQGHATFTSKHSIQVAEHNLNFATAVIASGGTARIPAIPGLKVVPYLTNATIFNLTELPARFGVIGAGPIGMTGRSYVIFTSAASGMHIWCYAWQS
jgi:pyruvate/2-oxoglutarate dehydrogenase complex dihydrolipoamide dehydrogenase (E3) component